MTRYLLLVLIILSPALNAQEAGSGVCRLLMKASNRDPVVATGLINGSTQHGFFLSDEANLEPCRDAPSGLRTTPGAAVLVFLDYAGVSHTADERKAIDGFRHELDTLVAKGEFKPFRIQVSGTLLVNREARINRAPGFWVGNGFGQDGKFPLLLVVKSVRRVE